MIQESFEIKIENSKNKETDNNIEDEEYSDLTDDEISDLDCSDEEQSKILDYLSNAFRSVANVEALNNNEFDITFYNPNVLLIEDEDEYDFDIIEGVPYIDDVSLFIPFVNFIKNNEPSLTGVALYTNLEGGGNLII